MRLSLIHISSDALAIEDPDSEAAQTYANVLVVKEGNENLEKITALKEALLSQTVKAVSYTHLDVYKRQVEYFVPYEIDIFYAVI